MMRSIVTFKFKETNQYRYLKADRSSMEHLDFATSFQEEEL